MPEKTERKDTEAAEWGEWFEKLIRGEIRRDSKVRTEGQAGKTGRKPWQQQ